MLNPVCVFRSALRLTLGAIRAPGAVRRGHAVDNFELISFDVFATLLQRCGDDDAAWRDGSYRLLEVAGGLGARVECDPLKLRREVEFELSTRMIASGRDPEYSHVAVLEQMLTRVGVADAPQRAEEIARWELVREQGCTQPIEETVRLVRDWSTKGKRIVAISDTRYTGHELAAILSHHSISGLACIYSSADLGKSKFSGKLFDEVARRESAPKAKILHIGDDIFTDVLSPAQRGIAVRKVRARKGSRHLPIPPTRADKINNEAFLVGYETLGPVLVAFTLLLLAAAKRDRIEHLSFVARDGELLLRIAQALPFEEKPRLGYLEISRRALAPATLDLESLNTTPKDFERVLEPLRRIRSLGPFIEQFQNYYGISPEFLARHLQRLGLSGTGSDEVRKLLGDPLFISEWNEPLQSQTDLLRKFLLEQQVLSQRTALVDIGWRGSLQKSLESRCRKWGVEPPRGYYFGVWNEDSGDFPANSVGLISDQRRGRNLLESSAWQCAFLLEAVCRAKHGMVRGFREDADGKVRALCVDSGETRKAEQVSEEVQTLVQEGVMAYVNWFSGTMHKARIDEKGLRKASLERLHQLAFFPKENEIVVGRRLSYSEPTNDDEALPLILSKGRGFKNLVLGVRSPWKGGYMQSAFGKAGAFSFRMTEWMFCNLPIGTKSRLRRILIRFLFS